MLDISFIVAGIICQIRAGTFGKGGEGTFHSAKISDLATKFRLCRPRPVSSLMSRDHVSGLQQAK
jgi:hypothetical protein